MGDIYSYEAFKMDGFNCFISLILKAKYVSYVLFLSPSPS